MIIGVTQRIDKVESYDEWRDAVDQRLIDWVVQSGFVPIPVPNILVDITSSNSSQEKLDNWLDVIKIDSVLLSGGNNIGDFEQRDLTEKYLLSWAEKHRKPVLGICRGMQIMGIYSGGRLTEVDGHVRTSHQLKMNNNNAQLLPITVNSYHNLALESCPNGFEILAKSEDGNLEAIKHKELPWEGWMWHPEREEVFEKTSQNRFINLINNNK